MSEIRLRRKVDAIDTDCEFRPCFHYGFDKGTFTLGGWVKRGANGATHNIFSKGTNGYRLYLNTSDHKPPEEGIKKEDGSILLVLVDPLPCCDRPSVAPWRGKYPPFKQRCRSCGVWLRGKRLEMARAVSGV